MRRAHVVGEMAPLSPVMGARERRALEEAVRTIDGFKGLKDFNDRDFSETIAVGGVHFALEEIQVGPDGVDPEIGLYVERQLSISEIERLIDEGVQFRLLPDGTARVAVSV